MNKRGITETAIVLLVLTIAIIGAVFVFLPTNTTSGMHARPSPYQSASYKLPMLECQSECTGTPVGQPSHLYPSQRQGGAELQKCLAECYQKWGITQSPSYIAGSFAVGPKEYGGSIAGIAQRETRAFPAGRAYEMPDQMCFKCSCLKQGITATDRATAQRVCTDNCGGTIAQEATIGVC